MAKEFYKATEVEGLVRHLANGINKYAPILNDYVDETIEKHLLEVVRIDD